MHATVPRLLACLAACAGLLGPAGVAAAQKDCVEPSELSLGGVALGMHRAEVRERLGKPVGQWTESGDPPTVHLVYPGLEVELGKRDTVVRLTAQSPLHALPSGVHVGMPREEVWTRLGLALDPSEVVAGFTIGPVLCGEGSGRIGFAFDEESRVRRIFLVDDIPPEEDPVITDYWAETKARDEFPWSKGPLAYLRMLEKHRYRVHITGDAPAGWVQESDLPALVALVKSGKPCAATQRVGSAAILPTRSTLGQEARFLVDGFREGKFPPSSSSLWLAPKADDVLAWWAEWQESRPVRPWPQEPAELAAGSAYEADFRFSAERYQWEPVGGLPLLLNHSGRIEWANPDDFFQLGPPSDAGMARHMEHWGPIRITFKVVSREIQPVGEDRWGVTYTCKALRVIEPPPAPAAGPGLR